jgi:predicted nucleic acid-binding protein
MEREEEALRFVIDTNILIGALVKDNFFLSPTFKRS